MDRERTFDRGRRQGVAVVSVWSAGGGESTGSDENLNPPVTAPFRHGRRSAVAPSYVLNLESRRFESAHRHQQLGDRTTVEPAGIRDPAIGERPQCGEADGGLSLGC